MSSQGEYIDMAESPEKKQLLKAQWVEATEAQRIHCECGQRRALTQSYRCLYCGQWYCFLCAEVHFGKTMIEWKREKRAKQRLEVRSQKYPAAPSTNGNGQRG